MLQRALATAFALVTIVTPVVATAQHKFALQLFHFNVQYVCGGTIGFTVSPNPVLDLDNDATEDRIITESFAPIVELFERHPSWGVDLEMQAYMLDIVAARHPMLLDKLRRMAKARQIDVVSFHYADQLFIGYPQEDWERSQDLAARTFAEHDVPLSRTVFCQEGQSAMAMAPHMALRGYRTMVWPKNLWIFQHGDFAAEPLYRFADVYLLAGSQAVSFDDGQQTIEVTWTFLNDGELLATGDFNPYFPEKFWHDPAAVAVYEEELTTLEQQGYAITTVDRYVETVKALVPPSAHPPLLDGTWQPSSTGGVKRWLGGQGLWIGQERDNHVRTLGVSAHHEIVAAETVALALGVDATEELDSAWRTLFLGQVTDATGINPFRGEIQYGISHFTEALRIAREVISSAKASTGFAGVTIDPIAGTVVPGGGDEYAGEAVEAPIALVIDPGDRSVTERWERIGDGHHRVIIDFSAGEFRAVGVTFPGQLEDAIELGLALDDGAPAALSRSDFTFESFHFALPTGWVGLGGGRFVVKDTALVHLAAEVWREQSGVLFHDETTPPTDSQRWVFHLIDGSAADAARVAFELNARRRLVR